MQGDFWSSLVSQPDQSCAPAAVKDPVSINKVESIQRKEALTVHQPMLSCCADLIHAPPFRASGTLPGTQEVYGKWWHCYISSEPRRVRA